MPVISSVSSAFCYTNLSFVYPHFFNCFDYPVSFNMFISFTFANLLLLPLYIVVLWTGFRRWRLQRSATSRATVQSDVFTYHMATVDISGVLGSLFFSAAVYPCSQWMKMVGYYFFSFAYPGQTFLHCLTCVERYLAVVYPLTYRRLRLVNGSRIRNLSIACALLLCLVTLGLTALYFPRFPSTPLFAMFGFTVFVVLFCSISILWALFRLGVGKVGGEQVDGSKLRALCTIMAITGALALRSVGLMMSNVIFDAEETLGQSRCVMLMSGVWMSLPSNLILPLLFLQRARNRNNKG